MLKANTSGKYLKNFKLTELYSIFANNDGYEKYIGDLLAASKEYTNRAVALSALHAQALLHSAEGKEEFDPADAMCQMFDCMSKEDQERFCEGMFQKKEFFEDAYKNMMNVFENVLEKKEENGIGE